MLCNACKQDKQPSDFYSRVKTCCKNCHKAAMRVLRLTNPDVQRRDRERAKQPARRAKAREIAAKWRADHPEAYRAQTKVGNAIRDGKLKREPCAICGASKHVHAHHQDYSKPLAVKWLCAKCHHRLHATFPELGGHHESAR